MVDASKKRGASRPNVGLPERVKLYLGQYDLADLSLFLLAVIQSLAIAQQDSTLVSQSVSRLFPYASYALVFLSLVLTAKELCFSGYLAIPFFYLLITSLDVYSNPRIQNFLIFLILELFLLEPAERKIKLLSAYIGFIVIMAVFGVACFASYSLGLPLPYRDVEYYFGHAEYMRYIDYGVSYLYSSYGSVRLCGLFNEPGYFGTIVALVLCIKGFNRKSWTTYVLLIAGVMSFSLAFFVIITIYFVAVSVRRPKQIIGLLVFVGLLVFASSIMPPDSFLSDYLSRITDFLAGGNGDERSSAILDVSFSDVVHGENWIWGFGGGYSATIATGVLTLKTYVIDYGLLGSFILFGFPLLSIAVSRGLRYELNIHLLTFLLCFAVSVIQRPNIYSLSFFILLFAGPLCMVAHNELLGRFSAGVSERDTTSDYQGRELK